MTIFRLTLVAVALVAVLVCVTLLRPGNSGPRSVLLVGDSISQCYAPGVAQRLGDRYRVELIPENGQSTRNLLEHLDEWVISEKPDVIVLNAGLHDVASHWNPPVPFDEYETNLRTIVRRIKSGTSARLIWATTTPVVDEIHLGVRGFARHEKDVERYNEASLKIMEALDVSVIDLHAVLMAADPVKRLVDGVHPDETGAALLADAVARAIQSR